MVKWSGRLAVALTATVALSVVVAGAQTPAKRPITHDVYDRWTSIRSTQVSRDGGWLVYALVPQDGDGELVARNLRSGLEHRQARGQDPIITTDGRFVVFTIAPPKADVDRAKQRKSKPEDMPKNGLGILSLETGRVTTVERVKSFKVPEESSRAVAYLLEPEKAAAKEEKKEGAPKAQGEAKETAPTRKEKKHEPGTTLVVRKLAAGTEATIPEVTEYVWSRDGAWLAYAVSSATPERDGVYVRSAEGATRPLLTGKGYYRGLVFDEPGRRLVFLTNRDAFEEDPSPFAVYAWRATDQAATLLVSRATAGLPSGWAPSEHGRLAFARDGSALYLGTAPLPPPEPGEDAPEPIKVDLWHYKDPLLQPMQKVRAEEEKKRTYRAVVHLSDGRFVQLADPAVPEVTPPEQGGWALGAYSVPYQPLLSWDGEYNDYYVVDLRDGSRRRVVEKAYFDARLSPGGQYVYYFDDEDRHWHTYRVSDGRRFTATAKVPTRLTQEDWDTPNQPAPYGVAGWTANDAELVVYDRFDIWAVAADGSTARSLTQGMGRAHQIVFRYQRVDPDERAIPVDRPLLLSATDDRTKASGYYRVGPKGTAPPERLLMVDKRVGGLVKAKNADVFVFTQERFDEFPDLWVSDAAFTNAARVTDANPQQREFIWGRSELIDYLNADGVPLRAILTTPENFDPTKKYPLMVYIYEQLSQGLHRYVPPAPGTSINITRYVSNGYVVLQPDIVYREGYPGESAFKCVIPAVQKVVSMGFIDPARVGIQGHSWGGYQITYLITRTNMFRAVEAGAAVSNMISAYGGIRWGTGMSRAFQYEKTQSRIGAPPWDRTLEFIENSPIFWVEKIQTPYLTIHNDEDDAVPWYQGIEFISAMRRLGKEAYMFVYNGEKHGLRERENQKHWTVHMAEFFDHYLLGAPRPAWMDHPVPYLQRGTRDLTPFYGKKTTETGS